MRYLNTLFLLFALLFFAGGCGANASRTASAVVAEGSDVFPSDSLRDWRSYADHVVIYTVVSDNEIPLRPEDEARGEGTLGREVALRVDKVIWSAPTAAPLPDGLIKMRAAGWTVKDGVRHSVRIMGAPRLEVGERFLAPVVRVEDPLVEWWPLTGSSQMPLDDHDRVTPGDSGSPVRGALAGKSIGQVQAEVEAATPDPLAERFADLRPLKRIKAVYAAGG
jgi:hypothetical protein